MALNIMSKAGEAESETEDDAHESDGVDGQETEEDAHESHGVDDTETKDKASALPDFDGVQCTFVESEGVNDSLRFNGSAGARRRRLRTPTLAERAGKDKGAGTAAPTDTEPQIMSTKAHAHRMTPPTADSIIELPAA